MDNNKRKVYSISRMERENHGINREPLRLDDKRTIWKVLKKTYIKEKERKRATCGNYKPSISRSINLIVKKKKKKHTRCTSHKVSALSARDWWISIFFMHPLQRRFFDKFVEARYRTSYLPTVSDLISLRVLYRYACFLYATKLGKKKINKFIDLWRIEILFCISPTTILDLRYHLYLSHSRSNHGSRLRYVTSRYRYR